MGLVLTDREPPVPGAKNRVKKPGQSHLLPARARGSYKPLPIVLQETHDSAACTGATAWDGSTVADAGLPAGNIQIASALPFRCADTPKIAAATFAP